MPDADRRVSPEAPEADDLIRQAVDDLLDADPTGEADGDPDDLIASMADDAIDRILAGGGMSAGDPAPPSPAPGPAPRAATPPPPVPAADEDELDALLRGDKPARPATPVVQARSSAADAVAAELDLDAGPAAFEDDDDPLAGAPDLPAADAPAATGAREIEADAALEERPGLATGSLPLWARPLAWMNRPLDRAGDNVRDFVGKVALVTFANAAGVLVFLALRG